MNMISINPFEISPTQPRNTNLPDIYCRIIISILQDCIFQLNILGSNMGIKIEPFHVKQEIPSKRFGGPDMKEELKKRRIKLPLNDQILKKMQSERTFIEGVLYNTIQDLKHDRKFSFLERAVRYLEETRKEEKKLFTMEMLNQEKLQKLQTDISEIKKRADLELTKNLETAAKFKDKFNDEINTRKVIKKFVEQWEKNKLAQLVWKHTQEMKMLSEEQSKASKSHEEEFKINECIKDHLIEACKKLEDNIVHWKEKYEIDIGNLEESTRSLKFFKEQQLNNFRELEGVYNIRQNEMDKFLAMKKERQKKEAREALEHESAIRLQSWWRGLMVRRCLGQFRRRKKVAKDPKVKKKTGGKSPKGKGKN